MNYTPEWLLEMCATAGGRAEVLRLLAEPNHFKDIVFGRGPDVRFPQMCQDCVVQGDINGIAERLKQAERRVEETNRIIDGICAAYDTGVEPNPEHFPFAAKVAELRHEVNDLRYEIAELRAHEAAEVKTWKAAHAAMQRMKTKLDVARNELLNIVQVIGVSDARRDHIVAILHDMDEEKK